MTARALIETVRVIDGVAPLWSLHLGRLTASGIEMRLPVPELEPPAGGPDRVVRFEVGSSGVQIDERDVGSVEPLVLVASPAAHRGYRHKTTERAWLEAARTTVVAQQPEADDALLLDRDGRVVEATRWAIGWWDHEALCFPPLTLGGLPSVARHRLGEMVRGRIREAEITTRDLRRCSVVACNAARGVVPVASVDGHLIRANHRTAALAKRFWRGGNA